MPKIYLVTLFLIFSFFGLTASADQVVGKIIHIEYPNSFYPNENRTKRRLAVIPEGFRVHIHSMDSYSAEPIPGIGEIRIENTFYSHDFPYDSWDIDQAANGSIDGIEKLFGVTGLKSNIVRTNITGQDSRQISISAKRFGGSIGVESLLIANRQLNALHLIMITFGAPPMPDGNNSTLTNEHEIAREILRSVKLSKSADDQIPP